MSLFGESLSMARGFLLFGQTIPRGMEGPVILIGVYLLYLIISAVILYVSVKAVGYDKGFLAGLPAAIFTVFVRDLIIIPLIMLAFFLPLLGLVIGVVVWLGLIKYVFAIKWWQAVLGWLVSLLIPIVIALFILIPILIMTGVL
jgi:hypothetical protein